jgi:ribosomal protein S20
MSVDSISQSCSSNSAIPLGGINQLKQDMQALQKALESGDLAGAQKAFAAFQQDIQNAQAKKGTPTNTANPSAAANQAKQDLDSLQKALDAGDLSAAKTSFAAFQKDVQSARGGHHHHRMKSTQDSDGSQSTSTNASSTASTATTGTVLNITV